MSSTSLTLSWVAPSSSQISTYVVEWTVNGQKRNADSVQTQFQITGLSAGEQYTVLVYSKNNIGDKSATAASLLASTCKYKWHLTHWAPESFLVSYCCHYSLVVPLPPSNLNVDEKSVSSLKLSWTAPSSSQIPAYIVEWVVNGQDRHADTAETHILITGLSAGEQYTVFVYSKNSMGDKSVTAASVSGTTCKFFFLKQDRQVWNVLNFKMLNIKLLQYLHHHLTWN